MTKINLGVTFRYNYLNFRLQIQLLLTFDLKDFHDRKKDTSQRFIDPNGRILLLTTFLMFQFSVINYAQDCVEIACEIPFFLDLSQLFLLISWEMLHLYIYIKLTLKLLFKNFFKKTKFTEIIFHVFKPL